MVLKEFTGLPGSENNGLEIYTVYDHPTDYPDSFVVRRWRVIEGKEIPDDKLLIQSKDLNLIENILLEMGLTPIPRLPGDDPVILKNYI